MKTLKNILGVSALSLAVIAAPVTSAFSDTDGHWVADYLDTAVSEGVVDSTKSEFRPDANINRAELVKIVVNYDIGGENPTSEDYEAAAGFSDVASSAWFYHHVNYAAEEGIVDGTKSEFRPAASMTRAEALKVITLALSVPSDSTKELPYSDVSEGDWYYTYVNNAYNNCVIKGASAFRPNDTITRAEAIKIFVGSLNPGCEDTSTPAPTTEATSTPEATTTVEATTTTTTTTESSNTVEVVVNNSIDTTNVPKGGTNVDLLALDITAGSAEDVKLTGVTVYHTGHGDEDDIDGVKVFDGYTQKGNNKSFSGDDDVAAINLGSESVVIPAGTTKTIFVKADIDSGADASVSHGVQIADASGISIYGVETGGAVAVSGSFPIAGPQREVANFTVGSVSVEYKSIADDSLEVGSVAAELANLKLTAGDEEDIWVKSLTVELEGVDDGDIANLFVEVDGVVVSDVVASAVSDDVTFDLTKVDERGVMIEDSASEYLYVKGDLTAQIDSFDSNNSVTIDSVASDIVAIGAKHGFEISKTISGTAASITFGGGDFKITLDGETSDVASDADDVVLGTLTIENFGSEAEIQDTFNLTINASEGTSTACDTTTDTTTANTCALSHIENITLVDVATGKTVFGPVDPTTNNGATSAIDFNDTHLVAATSKLVLEVQADTTDKAEDNESFTITYTVDTVDVYGGPDLDDSSAVSIKPSSGTISANAKTVALPSVTFAGKSLGGDNVVESASDVVVWTGTVRSNDVEEIKVTRVAFAHSGTATTSDVNDYSLYAVIDGEETALETSVSSGATFTFSSLKDGGLMVPAGEEIELLVKTDIAAEATANNTVIIALDVSEIQAKDEDGDFLVSGTSILPAADIASGATFTLKDSGDLTVTLDASRTPDAAIALAGEEVSVAVFKFEATDEPVKVSDFVVTVTEAGAPNATANSSVDSLALYYEDTGVAVLKSGGADATASVTGGEAFFEGLDLVIAEGEDTYIEVRALIDGIDDNDSQQTAESGDTVTITLDLTNAAGKTDIQGAESGTAITHADVASTETFTILNNKLIATEVALSSTTLTVGTKELVKFTLDVQGDNEAYLTAVVPTVSLSSGVTLSDDSLQLKEGSNVYYIDNTGATINASTLYSDSARTTAVTPVIKTGKTYVLEGTIGGTIVSGSSVSADITVNSGSDGITWKDYGTDGSDGISSSWIDLGDSSVSRISGSLSN